MFERPLKLTHNDSHRVYFTSDTHFNHDQKFIYESRGYKNRYEHNDALINKINELVRAQDILFHLGDFCLNIQMEEFNTLIKRINCQHIHYIWGNHNSRIRELYEETMSREFQRNDIEVYPYTVGRLIYQGYYKEITVEGQAIVLHHYPHDIFNQQQKSSWQLSGHSHYGNPRTQVTFIDKKILDVSWDGHKKPLSFTEIQKIMSNKKNIKSDSHH